MDYILRQTVSFLFCTFLLMYPVQFAFGQNHDSENEFLDMDLSQLMQVTVTSVSKKPEPISNAASAVFVITQEDIHRSGATSIPEILRLAPGLQVAQFGANKWTIASRGFSGHFSNKLLVLIDGRTVYTPAFSGVYWDVQHTLLEDIDRIEVIRGPGATLWGSNAMNGVINIITKKVSDTQGGLVKVGVGTKEHLQSGFRYGGELNENIQGRAYFTYNKRDSFDLYRGESNANDDWDSLQGGFRFDGKLNTSSSWTLQGDIYNNDENQLVSPLWIPTFPYTTEAKDNYSALGWNLLGRWQKQTNNKDIYTLQLYYDYTERDELYVGQSHGTFDIDGQYQTHIGEVHNITAGLGYRYIDGEFDSTFQVNWAKEKHSNNIYSGFIQDGITLIPDELIFTLGTKWEHNNYTGNEFQPSGRLMWKPAAKHAFWTAVSRAVRTPSQVENSAQIVFNVDPIQPPFPAIFSYGGDGGFDSEELIAYEAGYRWFSRSNLTFDIALFYNDYDSLLTADPDLSASPLKLLFGNRCSATSNGLELVVDWQAHNWIDVLFTYTYLSINAKLDSDSTSDQILKIYQGSFPQHQISLNMNMEFSEQLNLNLWLRYVSKVNSASTIAESLGIVIDDYVDCDINLSYHPVENVEIMLVGQNLFQPNHLEFVSEFLTPPTKVERGFYAIATWTFN